jgi:hypothetical protein
MEELVFTDHAREEMQTDSITEDDVSTVISDADVTYDLDNGRTRYERRMDDGRQFVVIVEWVTSTIRTAWWDKRGSWRRRR